MPIFHDEKSHWPVIYSEQINFNHDTVEDYWLGAIIEGTETIQSIAKQCYLPIETVIHAIACRYFDIGEVDQSISILKEYLRKSSDSILHNFYLRCLLASPNTSQKDFREASLKWNKLYALESDRQEKALTIDRNPSKRLNIGVLCGYAKSTLFDVAFSPLFKNIDSSNFKCILFNIGSIDNDRLEQNFDTCIQLPIFDDDILTAAIDDHNIDILIDLNGRFRMDNPIEILLKRLAPIQISYGNMLASYSLECVQYIMTDKYTLLEKDEKFYSERVYRFKSGVMGTFDLPDSPISPLPFDKSEDELFTFGSFNASFKLNNEVLDTWCRILKKVPNSRLLLKASGMESQRLQSRLINLVKKYQLDDRILIEGFSPMSEMLDRYKVVDLALNTFPYSGGTTTVYALWNGVPSLTLFRDGMVQSGGGEGVLQEVGLEKFVANSIEQYIEKAVYFANKTKELSKLRQGMRKRLAKSARFNPKMFAKDFEEGLRYIWKDWLENENNDVQQDNVA